ncbi:MAG: 2'-deoxycytidine 5'-triphosphate deaminase, partial [Candidatus Eisenbacteria bacterium]|nr:2'-deoxycytidine 5'-triphosphate deaminase [Candidatus Eisenbacteria bacterium]
GYVCMRGSIKPFGGPYEEPIKRDGLIDRLEPQPDGTYILKAKQTYLFKVAQRLCIPSEAQIYGQATTKSSIGRMDVLARLVIEQMTDYDTYRPLKNGQSFGDMFLEITPITFPVRVRPGLALTQLRLFYDDPQSVEIQSNQLYSNILAADGEEVDGTLSVDLSPITVSGEAVSAFSARPVEPGGDPLPLWQEEDPQHRLDPCKYWQFERLDQQGRLTIKERDFYILRSREHIAVPKGIAVYCRAFDETFGEMRIHYAGFVHPLFGRERADGVRGTPLIFEVRGHDVNVSLRNGEKMARLTFYRMSEDVENADQSYNDQLLQLSNRFAPWPECIKVDPDGSVRPVKEADS